LSYGRVAASRQAAEATRKRRVLASAGIGSGDSPRELIRAALSNMPPAMMAAWPSVAVPRRRRRGDSAVIRCGIVSDGPRAGKLPRNYGTLAAFSSCAV